MIDYASQKSLTEINARGGENGCTCVWSLMESRMVSPFLSTCLKKVFKNLD